MQRPAELQVMSLSACMSHCSGARVVSSDCRKQFRISHKLTVCLFKVSVLFVHVVCHLCTICMAIAGIGLSENLGCTLLRCSFAGCLALAVAVKQHSCINPPCAWMEWRQEVQKGCQWWPTTCGQPDWPSTSHAGMHAPPSTSGAVSCPTSHLPHHTA